MANFFSLFASTIAGLLTSKKVLTAVGTGLAAYNTDGDLRKALVGVGMALILGQGATDFGKASKQK